MSTIHHNGTSKKINKSEIEPQEKPQGIWIPMPIWEMTNDGKLSFLDLRLLMRINSYVTAKGAGCWASNGRLAEDTGVTRNHAAARIAFLKSLGLVIEVGTVTIGNLKRKLLETSWSCVFPRQQDPKLKKKAVRNAIRETLTKKDTQISVTLYKQEVTYTTDRIARYTADRTGTYTMDRIQSSIKSISIKEEETPPHFSIPHDGFTFEQNVIATKKKSDPVIDQKYINAHKRLKQIIHSAKPSRAVSQMSLINSAEELRRLVEKDLNGNYEAFETVLEDYAEHINAIPRPSISGAKQFRQHFNWICDLINKEKEDVIVGNTYTGI